MLAYLIFELINLVVFNLVKPSNTLLQKNDGGAVN